MQAASDFKMSAAFALLLIGPPKNGKTAFAMSFPDPYILDCDNNLAGALRYHNFDAKPFPFYFDNPNDVEEDKRWSFCMDAIKKAIAAPEPKTIIVDGLSLLAYYLERHILANSKKGNGQDDLVIAGEKVMNQSQWGPFRNLMSQLVMACKAAGKPFIMTCHEYTEVSKTGAVTGYKPLISGQLRNNIAGYFTDVWRCAASADQAGAKYTVRFAPKTLMQIGNSLNIKEKEIAVTNATRVQMWGKIAPFLHMPKELVA
jgi:hypothetical protein